MENNLTTPTDIATGGEGVAPAAEQVAGTNETSDTSVSLRDLLKNVLGKDFPSDEAAVKSLKDTYSYVGKAGQVQKELDLMKQQTNGIDTSKFISREQYEQDMWYSKHPEYADNKEVISALAQTKGTNNLDEVVKDSAFSSLFEKAKKTDELERAKSVLVSNPRISGIRDNMTAAREAAKTGDSMSAESLAAKAVIEAYDLKK